MGGCELIRVITMRHKAWLAWRSPPRLGPVPGDLSGGGGDRGGGAQVCPCGFGPQPPGVVPGGDEQDGGGVRSDPVEPEQSGRAGGDQRDDQLVQPLELAVQELGAAAELAQRQQRV